MESTVPEEKKGDEEQKHVELSEVEGQDKTAEIEVVERKGIKNDMSPFINIAKDWDDEDLKIPEEIKKNLFDMGFTKPSKIQAAIIPLASCEPFRHMIVQAPAGSGKTGAFGLTSLLRVDKSIDKIQVLVIVNTRELCNQIFSVYQAMTKGSGITCSNFADKDKKPAQVCVSIHGSFDALLSGRKPLDLTSIKCIVIDEADIFFKDDNFKYLWKVKDYKDVKKANPQWLLFSATYPDENDVKGAEMMSKIVDEHAKQIKLSASNLMERIKSVQQYVMEIEKGKKVDFIKEVFTTCEMTQTFIFVNTKNFAETVHRVLNQAGLKCQIMFSKMTKEERDKTMAKFRKQEIHVLITTDLIARGIDVPQAQLVINFDVPQQFDNQSKRHSADPATYLHRIGRTGRFGTPGVALTIWDRPIDKEHLDQIIKHYEMDERIQVLQDSEQLKTLLSALDDN